MLNCLPFSILVTTSVVTFMILNGKIYYLFYYYLIYSMKKKTYLTKVLFYAE